MSIITVFSGTYCNEEQALNQIINKTGYKYLTDNDFVTRAAGMSGLAENKIFRAFSAKTGVFNQFTHEKERSVAYLRRAAAEILAADKDDLLIRGFTSLLIPAGISHVLRVCLIANLQYRVSRATASGMSAGEAGKVIHKNDEDSMVWSQSITDKDDPWDASTYDMVLPTDKMSPEEIGELVANTAAKDILKASNASEKTIKDFLLAAQVETALVKEGHFVSVESDAGVVTLTINKHVMMLKRLEEDLQSIAGKVEGVKSVATKVGKRFYQADVYRKYDLEAPPKLLLVDDERKFVQTLSERLRLREMGSVVAYDGQSALDLIKEEEPEVMILDLKMPGIDGIQVLKQVKQTNPLIEVIILTGHGTGADKEICMELGAFAYLEKPVDVNVLSDTIKKANEKIRRGRQNKE